MERSEPVVNVNVFRPDARIGMRRWAGLAGFAFQRCMCVSNLELAQVNTDPIANFRPLGFRGRAIHPDLRTDGIEALSNCFEHSRWRAVVRAAVEMIGISRG
jgi:hypothetical protein